MVRTCTGRRRLAFPTAVRQWHRAGPGNIDRDAATRLTAQLLALDATSQRPVRLQFDTRSADLTAALLLADTLELLRVSSYGLVIGEVGGGSAGGPRRHISSLGLSTCAAAA